MQVSSDLMGQQISIVKLVIKVLVLVLMSDHDIQSELQLQVQHLQSCAY